MSCFRRISLKSDVATVEPVLLMFGSGMDTHSLLANERTITSIHLKISILIVFIVTSSAFAYRLSSFILTIVYIDIKKKAL